MCPPVTLESRPRPLARASGKVLRGIGLFMMMDLDRPTLLSREDFPGLLVAALVAEIAGSAPAFVTAGASGSWYADLARPAYTPPDWVFGPMWTLLFALMGTAAYLVFSHGRGLQRRIALLLFGGQFVLNIAHTRLLRAAVPGWRPPRHHRPLGGDRGRYRCLSLRPPGCRVAPRAISGVGELCGSGQPWDRPAELPTDLNARRTICTSGVGLAPQSSLSASDASSASSWTCSFAPSAMR